MPDSVLGRKPCADALDAAIEALLAAKEADELLEEYIEASNRARTDGMELDAIHSRVRNAKMRELKLRGEALERAFPKEALDSMVYAARGKVVKGS